MEHSRLSHQFPPSIRTVYRTGLSGTDLADLEFYFNSQDGKISIIEHLRAMNKGLAGHSIGTVLVANQGNSDDSCLFQIQIHCSHCEGSDPEHSDPAIMIHKCWFYPEASRTELIFDLSYHTDVSVCPRLIDAT